MTVPIDITGFCDANFVRTGYSKVGFCIFLGNNLYKYSSKPLKRVTTSTAMTERNLYI